MLLPDLTLFPASIECYKMAGHNIRHIRESELDMIVHHSQAEVWKITLPIVRSMWEYDRDGFLAVEDENKDVVGR